MLSVEICSNKSVKHQPLLLPTRTTNEVWLRPTAGLQTLFDVKHKATMRFVVSVALTVQNLLVTEL